MLQLQKALAALFAGCFCTMTFHQIPVLGKALLPRTKPIADAIRISMVGDTEPFFPPQNTPLPIEAPQESYTLLSEQTAAVPTTMETESVPVATPVRTATSVTTTTAVAETTASVITTAATETTTTVTEIDSTESETPIVPIDASSLFDMQETWFKAYMDYRTITDSSSVQYDLQQSAWTDSRGLRRMGDDYLVAMGTGWLTEGCGERFQVTLENGVAFTVMVGDVKADCHTDPTHRYRDSGGGANVLEFIVDTPCLSDEARNAGTVSVYPELEGNIAAIAKIEA